MDAIAMVADLRQHLRVRFSLTQGEAEIVAALSAGMTVTEHATQRGVSVHTVRTLLKRAMAKTHCTRQAQLVALALGGAKPGA